MTEREELGYEQSAGCEALVIDPGDRRNSGVRQINASELPANGYKEIGRCLTPDGGGVEQVVFYSNQNGAENGPGTALWWHYDRDRMGQFLSGPVIVLGGADGDVSNYSAPRDAVETYSDIVTGRYYTGFDIADYADINYLDEDDTLRIDRDRDSGLEL